MAMVISPEIFDPIHAHLALALACDVLMGPLGIKTLDPDDPEYNGLYLDGSDNYHQGPEWLYPAGVYSGLGGRKDFKIKAKFMANSGDIKNETEFLPLIIIYIILKTDSKKYDS